MNPNPIQRRVLQAGLDVFTGAAYGGITLTSGVSLGSVGSTFETITPFDAGIITNPRFVTQEFASGGVRLTKTGVWQITLMLDIDHNESNQGRSLSVRLFNEDASTAIAQIDVPVGRNQPGSFFHTSTLAELGEEGLAGDLIVTQLAAASGSFSSVVVQQSRFYAVNVGPFASTALL